MDDPEVTEAEVDAELGSRPCKCGARFEVERLGDGLMLSHPEPICEWFRETFVATGLAEPMPEAGDA